MYKLPDAPTPKADIHEIADFIEVECIRNNRISVKEIRHSIDKARDYRYDDGVPEEEELEEKREDVLTLEGRMADVLTEIDRRHQFCGTRYPFRVVNNGHVVTLDSDIDKTIYEIYTFLLFERF